MIRSNARGDNATLRANSFGPTPSFKAIASLLVWPPPLSYLLTGNRPGMQIQAQPAQNLRGSS